MQTVISQDGTQIAYDKLGQGKTVILVGGAFSFRHYSGMLQLTDLLAKHFTVINYDRRGRGDSGDTAPYAVEREIEDLAALILATGGSAYVWGISSGAVLSLKAAASGLTINKLALYEPPFAVDNDGHLPPSDFIQHLTDLIAKDRRGDAVKYFMNKGMGVPSIFLYMMRLMPGVWSRLKAVANTLPYDAMLLKGYASGKPLTGEEWASVTMPTLVMTGEKSLAALVRASQNLTEVLPNAQPCTLAGLSHTNIKMDVIAPALVEFFQD